MHKHLMERYNKIICIKMFENSNELRKIQASIYHKSLVEIVFQGFKCFVDKNSPKLNVLFYHFPNTNTWKYFLIQKLASFFSFGKNNSPPGFPLELKWVWLFLFKIINKTLSKLCSFYAKTHSLCGTVVGLYRMWTTAGPQRRIRIAYFCYPLGKCEIKKNFF